MDGGRSTSRRASLDASKEARQRQAQEAKREREAVLQGEKEPARVTRTASDAGKNEPGCTEGGTHRRQIARSPRLQSAATKKRRSHDSPTPHEDPTGAFTLAEDPPREVTPQRKRFRGGVPGTSVTSPVDPKTLPKFDPKSKEQPSVSVERTPIREGARSSFAIPPNITDSSPPADKAVEVSSSSPSPPHIPMPHTPPTATPQLTAPGNSRHHLEETVIDEGCLKPMPRRHVRIPRSVPASELQGTRGKGVNQFAKGRSVSLEKPKPNARNTPLRERLHRNALLSLDEAERDSRAKPAGSSSQALNNGAQDNKFNLFPARPEVIDVDATATPSRPSRRLSAPIDETLEEGSAGRMVPVSPASFYNSTPKKPDVAKRLRHDAENGSRPSPSSGRNEAALVDSAQNGHPVEDGEDIETDEEEEERLREKIGDGIVLNMQKLIESFGEMMIANYGFVSWNYTGLCESKLAELCPRLDALPTLRQLSLRSNKLRRIPDELQKTCERAGVISFERNRIPKLPAWLYTCTNIRQIDLSFNHLTSLSPSIGELENLEMLNISHNLIRELPLGLGKLKKLQILDAKSNKLERLPADFGEENSAIVCLDFSGNLHFDGPFPKKCLNFKESIEDIFVHGTALFDEMSRKERRLPTPELLQLAVDILV